MAEGKTLGKITHYFDKIGVAVLELNGSIKVGDKIKYGDHVQTVTSMQIDKKPVQKAGKGQSIGLKVDVPVSKGLKVQKA